MGLIALLVFSPVNAQTASRAILSAPNLEEFPSITSFLDIRDGQGMFIAGLDSGVVTVIEDDIPVAGNITEIRPGAQIVVAFNPGSAFVIKDFEGYSRFDYISQALVYWITAQGGDGLDDLSLVTSWGRLAVHQTEPQNWLEAWGSIDQTTLGTAVPSLDVLSTALDMVSDPTPQPGMGRAVLFLTPTLAPDQGDVIQSLADRATQGNVRVSVGLVDSPTMFTSTSAAQLHALAVQTGGQFFAFSNTEPIPDFLQMFESSRRTYQLNHRSQANSAGVHSYYVVVNTAQGEVVSEAISYDVQLTPPNPFFLSPPPQIVRAIPDNADIAAENLEPREYPIEIVVEFPDTIQRAITRTTLYANGQVAAENVTAPFEMFMLDLSSFEVSEQIVLRVEALDELGLTGTSIDTSVQITVQRPERGILATLARNATVITIGLVGLAGGVFLLVLVLAGRIRPRRIGERKKAQAAYEDPVTQPLSQVAEQVEQRMNLFSRFSRRFPSPKLRKPKGSGRQREPFAYLVGISEEGEPVQSLMFEITTDEITFGSDANQAAVTLEDPAVDSLHSRLWRDDKGDFYIADQQSVAGTWVNYAPVTKSGCRVEHGDIIHIAKVGFRFTKNKPTRPRQPVVLRKEEKS